MNALVLVSLLVNAGGSVEGTVAVKVDGKPAFVKNALVFIKGYSTDAPKEMPELGQSGRAFEKVVLPVVKRSRVKFTNNEPDGIYHHVFNPDPKTKFDSKKYRPHDTYKSPELTYEGPINVFCDIHKEMISTLYVIPNDRFALLDTAEGDKAPFRITDIRPGKWTIVAWHRSAEKPVEREIEIVEGKTAKIDLQIDGTSTRERAAENHERLGKMKYPDKKPDGGSWGEAEDKW